LFSLTYSTKAVEDFYSLSALKINGDTLHFSELKGKKLMIVNTASLCGYTYQYGELQQLYNDFGGENFEIIGFPANNFGSQEPGSNEDIEDFCKENYGVTFTMMSKISVLDPNMHPVYQWLTQKSKNGVADSKVQWNFQKYLINEDGTFERVVGTTTSPLTQFIKDWIQEPSAVIKNNYSSEGITIIQSSDNNYLSIDLVSDFEIIETIELFDLSGNIIQNYSGDQSNEFLKLKTISTKDLISGNYYCLIKTSEKNYFKSFVIIR
jgi:glutathione peroxidase